MQERENRSGGARNRTFLIRPLHNAPATPGPRRSRGCEIRVTASFTSYGGGGAGVVTAICGSALGVYPSFASLEEGER